MELNRTLNGRRKSTVKVGRRQFCPDLLHPFYIKAPQGLWFAIFGGWFLTFLVRRARIFGGVLLPSFLSDAWKNKVFRKVA